MISLRSSDICFNWESIISANWYLKIFVNEKTKIKKTKGFFKISKSVKLTSDSCQYLSLVYLPTLSLMVLSTPPVLFVVQEQNLILDQAAVVVV